MRVNAVSGYVLKVFCLFQSVYRPRLSTVSLLRCGTCDSMLSDVLSPQIRGSIMTGILSLILLAHLLIACKTTLAQRYCCWSWILLQGCHREFGVATKHNIRHVVTFRAGSYDSFCLPSHQDGDLPTKHNASFTETLVIFTSAKKRTSPVFEGHLSAIIEQQH